MRWQSSSSLPWIITALVMLLMLVVGRVRNDGEVAGLRAMLDSMAQMASSDRAYDMARLAPGDTLPSVELVSANGSQILTSELKDSSVGFLLFYRNECGACGVAERFWTAMSDASGRRVLKVAFAGKQDVAPDSGDGYVAWRHSEATRDSFLIQHIPMLAEISGNRIVAVASGLPQVSKLAGYYGLIDKHAVDSVRAESAEAARAAFGSAAGGAPARRTP